MTTHKQDTGRPRALVWLVGMLLLSGCFLDSGSNTTEERTHNLLGWWVQYGSQSAFTVRATSTNSLGTQTGLRVTVYKNSTSYWNTLFDYSAPERTSNIVALVASLLGASYATFQMTEPNISQDQRYTSLGGAAAWGDPANGGTSALTTFAATGYPASTAYYDGPDPGSSTKTADTSYAYVNGVLTQMIFHDGAGVFTGLANITTSNGVPTQITFVNSDGITIVAQVTNTLDTSGRILTQVVKTLQSGLLTNSLQWTFTYTGTGRYPATIVEQQWDTGTSLWVTTVNTAVTFTDSTAAKPSSVRLTNKLDVTTGSQLFQYNFIGQRIQHTVYSDYLTTVTESTAYSF